MAYQAVLFVSFGGPEKSADVMPFLENVTRGRDVPRQRLLEVAQSYELFGGVSPINEQNRALIAALEEELARLGPRLPVYFGNRNWLPYLKDAIAQMRDDGIESALAFATSAYSSYSGCRQYREDIEAARSALGSAAPRIDKIRAFWNHPGFIEPMIDSTNASLSEIDADRLPATKIVFTAHSLPLSMARSSDYERQLRDACSLVAAGLDYPVEWELAYQSRSGPPSVPWLEPDVLDVLERLSAAGVTDVVNLPIGFICEHMEVKYDLDTQARQHATVLGLNFLRAATAASDPRFVSMIRELIVERVDATAERRFLGSLGAGADECAADCCPPPRRPRP